MLKNKSIFIGKNLEIESANDFTAIKLNFTRQKDISNYKVFRINGEDVYIYKHHYTSSLTRFDIGRAKLHFLKNFQNPCFLEEIFHEFNAYIENRQLTVNNYIKKVEFTAGMRKSKALYMNWPGIEGKVRLRCLPNFLLLGVAKSGTTDFGIRVTIHPLIFKGIKKEYYWWDQYRFIINSTLSDYSDMFDPAVTAILGEKDNNNFYKGVTGDMTSLTLMDVAYWRTDPRNAGLKEPKYITAHDVYATNPNTKLIVILRNPVSRLYSQYQMFRRFKHPTASNFHMLVENSINWWQRCITILPLRGCLYGSPPEMPEVEHQIKSWWPVDKNYTGQIRDGLYYYFLKDWLNVFPRKKLFVINSDEYNKEKLKVMNNVFQFLDLPLAEGNVAEEIQNLGNQYSKHYEKMLPETEKMLHDFYDESNKKLAELLGDNKWLWK